MQRTSYILRANILNVFDRQTGYNIVPAANILNVFDRQTGYNIVPAVNNSICGAPDNFFNPRRIPLAASYQF